MKAVTTGYIVGAPRLISTIKVIRLRYGFVRGLFVPPNCPKYFTSRYEPLRDDDPGDIKRASINVKAQFPSDGYELMEDAFTPRVRPRLLRRRNDVKEWREKSVIDASIRLRI